MFWRDRPDGKLLRDLSPGRRLMPYLMPRRNEAVVYYTQKIDVTQTLDYLDRWNDGSRPTLRISHLYIAAIVRMFNEFPKANRFIAGGRMYLRNDIAISTAVLKARDLDATVSTVKQVYDPSAGLRAIIDKTDSMIRAGRDVAPTAAEREMALVSRLPGWAITGLLKLQKLGDWLNVTPESLARNDPLYASMMIAFHGSLGVESAFHHLFEHGTVSKFAAVGPVLDEVVAMPGGKVAVRPILTVRYSIDERIGDGIYAAKAVSSIERTMQNPWLMEVPDDTGPGAPDAPSRSQEG